MAKPRQLPEKMIVINRLAAMACSGIIRDTIARLKDGPEWRLEVVDEAGTIRHLFRLTAETFDP
jgi:hypothetical protein